MNMKTFLVKMYNAEGELVKEARFLAEGVGHLLRMIDETYHIDMMTMTMGICRIDFQEITE